MKQRIITALIGLVVFVPVLFFANDLIFRISFAIIAAVSVFELMQCTGLLKKYILSVPLIVFSLVVPMTYGLGTDIRQWIVIGVLFFCMATMVFSNGKITFGDVGTAYVGALFCTIGYECVPMIRERFGFAFLLIYLGAWGSDTFAYFVGRALGKHKLIPKISPKKTVEGAIGGAVAGMVLFPLFGLIMTNFGYNANYILLAVLGLLAAIISQIGDLFMSAVKRCYGVKDFGKIFPGHGGFLDRFDSTLTVAPIILASLGWFDILVC